MGGQFGARGHALRNKWAVPANLPFVWIRALVLVFCALGCTRRAPPGTALVESSGRWSRWIELTPAIRTPLTQGRRDRTAVYLLLANEGVIELANPVDRRSLRVPSGSISERVEHRWTSGAWTVADVRGTEFRPEGEWFHVLRPLEETALFGPFYRRGDAEGQQRARQIMRDALLEQHGDSAQSRATVARFGRLMDCAACHAPRTDERLGGTNEWPRRPTDARGLYSLLAVLSDESVAETYRPVDPNEGDPLIETRCAMTPCQTGSARSLRLNVRAGIALHDPHTLDVCRARRALAGRMSAAAREAWRAEISGCETAIVTSTL
jgi:hypothetical protein